MNRALCLLLALISASAASAATLTGETSRPTYSVFTRGEPVQLRFRAEGLQPGQAGLTLSVKVSNADERVLFTDQLPVAADAQGNWQGTLAGRTDLLGYYHVTAKLSSGEALAAVGSRPAGYLTYLVVTDPGNRVRAGENARFGLQGGFTTAFDMRPYLGVTWVLGGYDWGQNEPDRPGQFREKRAAVTPEALAARQRDRDLGLQPLFCLIGHIPKWAQQLKDGQPVKNVVGDLPAFAAYCRAVGKAAAEDFPHLAHRVYQVTWEPVYPWGFEGTDEDLLRLYQAVYPALHEADPRALVIGPTGAGISAGDLAWNERLLKLGLGKYVDAWAIHPYLAQPPEEHGLITNLRTLRELIRSHSGRALDVYGTEQGFPTGATEALEKPQAMWLTRSYLITVGEGLKMNTAFYSCDYPGEPGYGFFHNLVIEKQAWGPGAVSPKPVAGAFAAMTMLLEGHRTVGPIESLGTTTCAYAFERDNRVTLALWDYGRQPREVKLAVGVPQVEVFDWMGNGRAVPSGDGLLRLTLGPEPQYVRGVSPALWGSKAKRPLVIQPASTEAFPGDTVKLTMALSPPATVKGAAQLLLTGGELPAVQQSVTLSAQKTAAIALIVPPTLSPGLYPLQAAAVSGGNTWGVGNAMLRVREALGVGGVQTAVAAGGGRELQVRLRNLRATATKGEVAVRLPGVPHAEGRQAFTRRPGEDALLSFAMPAAGPEPGRTYAAVVSVREQGHPASRSSWPVSFTECYEASSAPALDGDLGEWATRPAIVLSGRDRLVRQPQLYRGRQDLAARVQCAWDQQALYLAVTVCDDRHLQPNTGFDTWKGDCLQVAVDMRPGTPRELTGNLVADTASSSNVELDLALTPRGPEVYRTLSPDPAKLPVRLLTVGEARLAVGEGPGERRYEAALPWSTLGRSGAPPPGRQLGFALAVNDLDEPGQLDPKALGLFGGITPAKDPSRFGRLSLAGGAPPPPPTPSTLVFDGALAQSQPAAQTPLPWTGCAGVAAAGPELWAVAGDAAYRFHDDLLQETVRLPAAMRLARPDGGRLVCLSHEGSFYELDLAAKQARLLCRSDFPDGKPPREFCVGPQGELYALGQDNAVRKWDRAGRSLGTVLALQAGSNWWYCALGADPASGDLWLGTYYPDLKLKRFPAGRTEPAEVREGGASMFVPVEGRLWWLGVGGQAQALATGGSRLPPVGDFTYYPTGAAPAADGGTWVSCAQGVVHFDALGRPDGRRLGGLGDPALLAAAPDGTVLVTVESSQRFARCAAGDAPGTPLQSNANEPWRVANGWSGRAAGLAWMGDGYLVLDANTKALWRFDPDHVGFAEKPWTRLTGEGVLSEPRALAVGEAKAFVLDGARLLAFALSDFKAAAAEIALPAGAGEVKSLAADGDERLIVAAADGAVTVFDRDGKTLWRRGAGATNGTVACADGLVAVVGGKGGGVEVAEAATGRLLASATAVETTVGAPATGVAVRAPWLYLADPAGHRVVRLRLH